MFSISVLNASATIEAVVLAMDTEASHDYVRIFDGNSVRSSFLGAYSGSDTSLLMRSSGQYLTAEFISDSSVSGSGFSMLLVPISCM